MVGIEPSLASLETARAAIAEATRETGLEVSFIPIAGCIETLDDASWRGLRALGQGTIVNASFALHHVGGSECDARERVLQTIADLAPSAIVLAEPDVDHFEPDFRARFRSCWAHFTRTFRAIDASRLASRDAEAVKCGFFGREIADILGAPDGTRSERHEPLATWAGRLARAGFVPAREIPPAFDPPSPWDTTTARGSFVVRHEGVPMTGVLWGGLRTGGGNA